MGCQVDYILLKDPGTNVDHVGTEIRRQLEGSFDSIKNVVLSALHVTVKKCVKNLYFCVPMILFLVVSYFLLQHSPDSHWR